MLESLGKTLRGKWERNINKKNIESRNRKNVHFTTREVKFHNPMKNKHWEIATTTVTFLTPFWQRSTYHFLLILAPSVLLTHIMCIRYMTKLQLPHRPAYMHWYFKINGWDRYVNFKPAERNLSCSLSVRQQEGWWRHHLWRPHPQWGPSQCSDYTCWKPRGGAEPDSLGSAQLPRAAAPALSQGLSCCRNTTRNCNHS